MVHRTILMILGILSMETLASPYNLEASIKEVQKFFRQLQTIDSKLRTIERKRNERQENGKTDNGLEGNLGYRQAANSSSDHCPSSTGWIQIEDSCYLMSPNGMTWHQAQQFCTEKGGYLAEIESSTHQTKLNAILNSDSCYWIGLSDLVYKGNFVWHHSNTPLGDYTNWVPGQPDNTKNAEDCVHLLHDNDWKWNDVNCDATKTGEWCQTIHAFCQSKKS